MTDSEKLVKLKQLLLDEDRDFALQILQKLDSVEKILNEEELLSEKVNPIIDKKIETFAGEIPSKLGPTITEALKVQIRDSQDQVVEALFPIIGKMIKKYIQQEMKNLSESINSQVQSTFSIKKWKRKFKSFFTGVSEESIILSEMAKPNVEQVFIIEKGSGLLIANVSKSQENIDKDMIAGMLTAIKSFVEDAFTKEEQSLELIQYELYNIYIQNMSSYYVAAVISGSFNSEFKDDLEDKILDFASKHKKEKLVEDSKVTNKLIESLFND